MAEPITPTPPKLTDAQKRAVFRAAQGGGPLYCAPASAEIAPRARWNVCQRLVELELLAARTGARGNVWPFMLTDAGMARASAIAAEVRDGKLKP